MFKMPISTTKLSPSPPPSCVGVASNEQGISLRDLLLETELDHYEDALRTQLRILRAEHLKDVRESDLSEIGMSKPEQRRLMKTFQKYFPSSLAGKFKQKVLHRKATVQTSVAGSSSWNNAGMPASLACGLRRCNSNEEITSAAVAEGGVVREMYAADDSQADEGEQHIIAASNIVLCRQLGKGEFGTVWQGVWTTSSLGRYSRAAGPLVKVQVAVKQIHPEKMLSSSLDFVREAAIMHRIHHEYIVKFFGVVLDTQTIMLVNELAPSRSLAECLKEERSAERFSIVQLCEFAQQIGSGMAYLEANRFIHRDLAARNILVFSSHKVKISDFGLSRALGTGEDYYRGNFNVNLKLPIAWCAPECINYLKFTSASDVWAFAVTLWEMFTYGFQPWTGLNGQQIFDMVNAPRLGRLECPDACPQEYYNLMLKCWQHEPEHRPKFTEIILLLPTIEPDRVITVKACRDGQLDHLQYGLDALITVLSKTPPKHPDGHYWRGVLKNGRTGLFLPTDTVAYLESQRPGMPSTNSISISAYKKNHQHKSTGGFIRAALGNFGGLARKSAAKNSFGCGLSKEKNGIKRPLISLPQNDLRHTGHLGLDGICFGDVAAQANEMQETKNHIPKRALLPPNQQTTAPSVPQKQRLKSYSSETACLLGEESGDYNSSVISHSAFNGDTSIGTDLDDVSPMAIVCGDSLGFFDEVLEAVDLNGASSGGCTNMGARFTSEDGCDFVPNVRATISPRSTHEDEESEDEEVVNDRKKLWLSTSGKKNVNGCGKATKERTVKPLSSADTKMLNEIDKLADKLSTKALDKERERLQEERRKLGLAEDFCDGSEAYRSERSPSPSSTMHLIRKLRRSSPPPVPSNKPSFTDTLAKKCEGYELRVSPEAENAYKTLIEGKKPMSNSVLLPREERDDPQRPSVEEDVGEQSPTEDDTNPLRMLRNEGANVIRRFTRQGSGRRQQLLEKPTPPIRRKHLNGVNESKPSQDGKIGETNGMVHSSSVERFESVGEGKFSKNPLPPPVPPRSSPKLESNRRVIINTASMDRLRPTAPAIPPKPKFVGSSAGASSNKKIEAVGSAKSTNVGSSSSINEGKYDSGCPAFTLEDVNKYDLLDFVLSALPESRKADERQKLVRVQEKRGSPPAALANGKAESISRLDQSQAPTRKEILIDDDVVHV